MGKALFGIIRWGKDASDDDEDDRYKISTDINDIRSEAAKQNNSQRPSGIVKDRQ